MTHERGADMSESIRIRVLGSGDEDVLSAVAEDVFDRPILAEQAVRFLGDRRHILVVALANELVVGMVSAVEYFYPDKPPALWINEVGVAPTHQRQGTGRRVLAGALDEGKRRGCHEAWVGTETDNVPARCLYEDGGATVDLERFVSYEWSLLGADD